MSSKYEGKLYMLWPSNYEELRPGCLMEDTPNMGFHIQSDSDGAYISSHYYDYQGYILVNLEHLGEEFFWRGFLADHDDVQHLGRAIVDRLYSDHKKFKDFDEVADYCIDFLVKRGWVFMENVDEDGVYFKEATGDPNCWAK